MRRRRHVTALASLLLAAACNRQDAPAPVPHLTLSPAPNPFGPGQRLYAPQPTRAHPTALALTPDGAKLYVALSGVEDEPGAAVAVVATSTGQLLKKIAVGAGPSGLAMHPGGRFVVVTNRFSAHASVIDTALDEVATDVAVPFYTTRAVFHPDGTRLYLTNRWKDSLLRWTVSVGDTFEVIADNYSGADADRPMGIPTGQNPRDVAISPSGHRLYVACPTSLSLSIIDTRTEREARRVDLVSPAGGVLAAGRFVMVTHTGRGSQHRPDEGEDTDRDGQPGDGTANVMFQDLQNELAVLDEDGDIVHNYTSDSICCRDFRDVDPDHPEKGAALPRPDTWPASRLAYLPPRSTWIMAGALPEQMALRPASGGRPAELLVVYSGSNEVQRFTLADDGALSPIERAGSLFKTGMNPSDIVVAPGGGVAYVSERLGEHLTVLSLDGQPTASGARILVGDVSGGEFPATDAEIGEAINFVTSLITVDGDQTCVHCHREGGNIAKPIAMPLQVDHTWGTRMVMAYRGASDTRPWFFETAMGESNFFPVINEFSRKENFCCDQLDPLVWSAYPAPEQCVATPSLEGCEHVLHCTQSPPPGCQSRTYGSPHLTRREHMLAGARALLGRDTTFGDALSREGAIEGEPRGIPLDFDGVTRALGVFLLQRPRLLPNPHAYYATPAAARGADLYRSPTVGCNTCHPLPLTTVTEEHNPSAVPLRFAAVITPRQNPSGDNVDRVTPGFVGAFPQTVQDDTGVRFGVPQLRGIWDRAGRFYHDGRAHSLREALCTPGHPALRPGEQGFNETFGMPDTHGATSTLSPEQIDDLIAFLLTL